MARSREERAAYYAAQEKKYKEKKRRVLAAAKEEERKERNHRIFQIGGRVDGILSDVSPEEREETAARLILLGRSVEEAVGSNVIPAHVKIFLQRQEERGKYFSRFTEQLKNGDPTKPPI